MTRSARNRSNSTTTSDNSRTGCVETADDKGSAVGHRHHGAFLVVHQQTELERLLALGATTVEWSRPPGADFLTLAEPESNGLDVVQI
jgi:hypothetical protein